MRNFFWKLPVWAAVVAFSTPVQAQRPQSRDAEPKPGVELAQFALPGMDLLRLAHFLDAARFRVEQAVVPSRWSSVQPAPARDQSPVVPDPKATAAYRHTFNVLLAHPEVTDRYDALILKYAALYRLDPRLLKSVIAAESEFAIAARSPRGARGLMQVMPATAQELGVPHKHLSDPEDNIRAGAAYLARLFSAAWIYYKLGDLPYSAAPLWLEQRVIAAYNAGPRFLCHDRWYPQTKNYVRKVVLFYRSGVTDIGRAPEALERFPKLATDPTGTLY